MKRFIVFVFAFLIISVIGALVAPGFIDWNAYKGQATEEVKKYTDYDLTINGDLNFTLLPFPSFSMEDATLKTPKGQKYDTLLSVKRLEVNVALIPLLKQQVQIQSIAIIDPIINIEKFKDGTFSALTDKLSSADQTKNTKTNANDTPEISLDNIRIKDGILTYYDHAAQAETKVQNINIDLSAQSLTGPYTAQGSSFFNGYALGFDLKTDAYDSKTGLITPDLTLSVAPSGIKVNYKGVISTKESASLQGQTIIEIEDVSKLAPQSKIKQLVARGLLTADAKKIEYKNVEMKIGEQLIKGALILPLDPLSYELTLKTQGDVNLATLIGPDTPFKTARLDLNLTGDATQAKFNKTSLTLDKNEVTLNGSIQFPKEKQRAKAAINLTAKQLDLNDFTKPVTTGAANAPSVDIKQSISAFALPIDLTLSLNASKVLLQGKEINGLSASVDLTEDKFNLSDLSIKDIAGSSIKMSSGIAALQSNPAINAYVDISSPNIKALAQWFDVDVSSLPAQIQKLNLKSKLSGSLDQLDMTTNISALGGEVIAKGRVNDPLNKLTLSDLILQLKHGNMARAIETLSGTKIADKNFAKPLDFYAKVNQQGQSYSLRDIKGDLSGITVQGQLDINTGGKVPSIKGALNFGKITLNSVVAPQGAPKSQARWSKDPIDVSALHTINADILLSAQSIQYGVWPLQSPAMNLSLKDGNLVITDLKAGVYGGSIDTSMKLQTVAQPRQPIYFESTTAFQNVDMGQLTKSLIGTQLVNISGKGGVDMTLKSSGASVAALILDLSGQGTTSGSDLVLQGVDITRFARALSDESKPGDSLTQLWKGTTGGGSTAFETLTGGFAIKNGIVALNNILLDGSKASIDTNGNINLPNWTLDTKHKMTVKGTADAPSDVPPFEMAFKGSLDNPAQTFGQGLLNDYLNRKIQRKFDKLLSDKLGLPTARENNNEQPAAGNDNSQQQQEQKKTNPVEDIAEEAIKGILGGILR